MTGRALLACFLLLALSACTFTGESGEPLPPFFGDYGRCLKQATESSKTATMALPFCMQYQYPNGDGPIFRREFAQYKEDHARWWRIQLDQSRKHKGAVK